MLIWINLGVVTQTKNRSAKHDTCLMTDDLSKIHILNNMLYQWFLTGRRHLRWGVSIRWRETLCALQHGKFDQ